MTPSAGAELPVHGTLTSRAQIALPRDARAVVEVREGDSPEGPVVAERRIDLDGQQLPVTFDLRIDRSRLGRDRRFVARGGLVVAGAPAWVTEPVALDVTRRSIDLGTLELVPFHATAFASVLDCGGEHATLGWVSEGAELVIGGERFTLKQARAASGTRYEAVGDSTTWIWNKGRETRVSVRGREYPPCQVAGTADETFRAHGNEPFWNLELTRTSLAFRTPDGTAITLSSPRTGVNAGSRRYVARGEGREVVAVVTDGVCRDDMSGMPYPNAVTVTVDGRDYRGCGGAPAALLQGKEWVVEDVSRGGIIDSSRLTLNFGGDGRVFGRAGCNTYNGRYTLTGESLTVADPVTTRKSCAPSLMQQEQKFVQVLGDVQRFDIDRTGALVLSTTDGRTILARR